jgi:hypothetical protein
MAHHRRDTTGHRPGRGCVIAVHLVDPCTDRRWEQLALTSGTLFHSPAWCRVVGQAFGITIRAALSCDDGQPIAGLLVAEIDDPVGRRQSTLPFSDFCGPIGVTSVGQWSALTDAIVDPDLPYSLRLRSHPVVAEDARLQETARFGWSKVDLGETEEEAWARVSASTRQCVRIGERSGLAITRGSDLHAVRDFHAMHSELRRSRYSMLAQPPAFFDAIHAEFAPTGDLQIVQARLGDMTVAGCFLLRWAGRAYYKFNTSRPEGRSVQANDFAFWAALNFARSDWRADAVDMGLSALDQPGLIRFKSKHTTHTDDLISYSMGNPTKRSSATRTLINDVTALFVDEEVPASVRDRAAAVLYRHFS